MKKIILILMSFCMISGASLSASANEPIVIDVYNNDLFEITEKFEDSERWNSIRDKMVAIENVGFNDGIIKNSVNDPNYWFPITSLTNASDMLIYAPGVEKDNDPSFIYSYNLGYLIETMGYYNVNTNSYTYETLITDIYSGDKYYSEKFGIYAILDDGTLLLDIAEEPNTYDYIAKLKKPALVTVYLDDQKIYFDQVPVIESGRTLVPLRAIFEALGAEVVWDDATRTVTATKDGTTVSLTIDNTVAYKNNVPVNLDVPAKIINSRTMVPVRFIADCFGVGVQWDGDMRRVILSTAILNPGVSENFGKLEWN